MNRGISGLVFISFLALFSCKPKVAPPTPPTPVNISPVSAQRVWYYDKYPATTQALSQVNIYPEAQGYITGIFFTEGSHWSKKDTKNCMKLIIVYTNRVMMLQRPI